ncbi:MAG TPA: hypothetical protein VLK26_06585 [Rudaea sp.]|nr:hypothetical protein [Rudaea sp.]
MPTTFTIKQVPDALADALRARAAANRRSLQRELLLIMETAAQAGATDRVAEPPAPAYAVASMDNDRTMLKDALRRARRSGKPMSAESAAIIRADRARTITGQEGNAMKITHAIDERLLESARMATGERDVATVLGEGLRALVEREAARRLIALGGSMPDARLPPRRRSAPVRKSRRVRK